MYRKQEYKQEKWPNICHGFTVYDQYIKSGPNLYSWITQYLMGNSAQCINQNFPLEYRVSPGCGSLTVGNVIFKRKLYKSGYQKWNAKINKTCQ